MKAKPTTSSGYMPMLTASLTMLRTRGNLRRAGLLLVLGAAVVIHLRDPLGIAGDITFIAVGWTAAGAAWVGARRAPQGSRLVPHLIAAGLASTALGDLMFRAYTWLGTTPDASLADIPWFSSYLGLGAALLITLIRDRGHPGVNVDALIDVLTVVTVSVLVLWNLSIAAIVSDDTVSGFIRAVWAAYPVADAVLLALVLRALTSRRGRAAVGFTFCLGVACWLAADLGFLLLTVSGTFSGWLSVGWMLGALLIARAAWRRPAPESAVPEAVEVGSGLGKLSIAIVPLMIPPVILLLDKLRFHDANPIEAVAGMAALLVLAFVRTARLLRSERSARMDARKSHRHYECLAANSSDAVIVVDADGRVMSHSPQLARLVGFEGPPAADDWKLLLAPVDPAELGAFFARVTGTPGQVSSTEVQLDHRGSGELWLSARMVNLLHDPDVEGVIIALADISDRKRAEGELSHQASHDGLTGLPNRALYRNRVEHSLERARRTGLQPAVLYLDVDGFKNVNDSLGHAAGDDLLREVARRLLDAVRSGDTVARLGGDEFAILLEQSPRPVDEAVTIADRVLHGLTAPFEVDGSRISMSVSIGIAAGDGRTSAPELVRNADIAMYRAKTCGKARWITYDAPMRAAADEHLRIETDIAGALELDGA